MSGKEEGGRRGAEDGWAVREEEETEAVDDPELFVNEGVVLKWADDARMCAEKFDTWVDFILLVLMVLLMVAVLLFVVLYFV